MPGKVLKILRRCVPPFSCYSGKNTGGHNAPPPTGRGLNVPIVDMIWVFKSVLQKMQWIIFAFILTISWPFDLPVEINRSGAVSVSGAPRWPVLWELVHTNST